METMSSRYEGALSFAHRSSPGAKISMADIDIVDRQCRDPRYSHEGGWTTKGKGKRKDRQEDSGVLPELKKRLITSPSKRVERRGSVCFAKGVWKGKAKRRDSTRLELGVGGLGRCWEVTYDGRSPLFSWCFFSAQARL
jgi:hypothetical protein